MTLVGAHGNPGLHHRAQTTPVSRKRPGRACGASTWTSIPGGALALGKKKRRTGNWALISHTTAAQMSSAALVQPLSRAGVQRAFARKHTAPRALAVAPMAQLSQDELKKQVGSRDGACREAGDAAGARCR